MNHGKRRTPLQDRDRKRRGNRRRNLPRTTEMPRVRFTENDMVKSAESAADGAISKLNTLTYWLKLLGDKESVADVESIISDVEDISNSI